MCCLAAGPESSIGLPSDVEDGEEAAIDGFEGRKASSGLVSPLDTGGGDEHAARYRSGRGGSRGRGGARGRGSRRRKADDEDDTSEIFEDIKGPNKRRKRGKGFTSSPFLLLRTNDWSCNLLQKSQYQSFMYNCRPCAEAFKWLGAVKLAFLAWHLNIVRRPESFTHLLKRGTNESRVKSGLR